MRRRKPTPTAPELVVSTVRLAPYQWEYLRAVAGHRVMRRGRGRADVSEALREIIDHAIRDEEVAAPLSDAEVEKLFPSKPGVEPEIEPMNGESLKAARAALEMTQAQLGAKLGMTPTSISRMERGTQAITPRTALAIRELQHKRREEREEKYR